MVVFFFVCQFTSHLGIFSVYIKKSVPFYDDNLNNNFKFIALAWTCYLGLNLVSFWITDDLIKDDDAGSFDDDSFYLKLHKRVYRNEETLNLKSHAQNFPSKSYGSNKQDYGSRCKLKAKL